MPTVRSEYNSFSCPVFPPEQLPAPYLLEGCLPHLRSLVLSSLSAIHHAAQDSPRLLAQPILGDGVKSVVDEEYAVQAIKGPYIESVKGIQPYAISAARVLGTTIAASKLIVSNPSAYVICNTRRRGETPVTHHTLELAIAKTANQTIARDLFLRRNVASLGIYFTTSRNQPTRDLRLSVRFARHTAGIFRQESSFVNLQAVANVYPLDDRPKEHIVTTSVSKGMVTDGFVHVEQQATFSALDPFCRLMNHVARVG